jgi:LacI family transcriptional regulator, galactose operon repressor
VGVSIRDVADRAGVSLGTVSNALNRPDRVAPPTLLRVRAAIEDLGFIRNEAARQLRTGRSRTIALLVLDVGNPFFTDVARGVERVATQRGLSLVLSSSDSTTDRQRHYLSLFQEQRSYGVLLTPVGRDLGRINELRRNGVPVVLVDHAGSSRQCSVSVDDVAGARLAAAHLIGLDHQRIAFAGGGLAVHQVADRLAGVRQAMAEADRPDSDLTVVDKVGMTIDGGREAGRTILAIPRRRRPTAVVCANDLIALGLLQHALRNGLAVPEELAIVGYDDIEFASAAAVPLTSVRQPSVELGAAAAELLIDEVERPADHHHRQVRFDPVLMPRESTSAASAGEGAA